MTAYIFQFDIKPEPWQRARCNTNTGAFFTPHNMRAFKNVISASMQKKMQKENWGMKTGLVIVAMYFNFKKPKSSVSASPRGDLDNYLKSILDAGNGILYGDDRQVVCIYATKKWSVANGITISVSEVEAGEHNEI